MPENNQRTSNLTFSSSSQIYFSQQQLPQTPVSITYTSNTYAAPIGLQYISPTQMQQYQVAQGLYVDLYSQLQAFGEVTMKFEEVTKKDKKKKNLPDWF